MSLKAGKYQKLRRMKMNEDKLEIMDVGEAAKYLRFSTQKVYQLKATDKTFPWHKVGESLRFVKDELRKWVLEH